MQPGKDSTLRLIIIDDSSEDAEAVVNSFRNNGVAVRPLRPTSADELARQLQSQPIDIVLPARNARSIPLPVVLEKIAASGRDVPVHVLVEALDEAQLIADIAGGASGHVLRRRPEHLLQVVQAEWANLNARRELRRMEAQVRETERRCDALIDSSRDPIAYVHEGMHMRANDAYLEMFGLESFEDLEGLSLLEMIGSRHVAEFKELLKQIAKGEAPPPRYETEARTMDGKSFPAVMEFAPATYESEPCIQVVFRRNLIEMNAANHDIDPATGLLNRPAFLRKLEDTVGAAARGDGQYALLLVQPDHYQRVSQEIGLGAIDALSAAMAKRIGETVGDEATVARFSDHTFAVLFKSDFAHGSETAKRLLQAFAAQVFTIGDKTPIVTASIGGVQIGEKLANVAQVLTKANENLQANTALGGNRAEIFDPGAVDREAEERMQLWARKIRNAIANNAFALHFMPVVNLKGEGTDLYECLLRLEDGGELINPHSFVGQANDAGLGEEIDRWVAANAIRLISERKKQGHDTHLMLKIGPGSFSDGKLLDVVEQALAKHGVGGQNLWLETTEDKVFANLRPAQKFLVGASQLGCRVGLERFGAGLDSFQLLAHFRPAFVKIDRSLIENFGKDAESQQKVREIVARGGDANITTIAEYVQDASSLAQLYAASVDYVQGYFLAQPGPAMNFDFSQF